MYNFCFKSCLVSLAIATALGVAAVWVPAEWYDVGAKLLWTDIILFVGATVGAFLCHIGIIGDKTPEVNGTITSGEQTTREIAKALRKEIRQGAVKFYDDK